MSTTTTIQWTDRTWNPVRGCSLVSAGCANCYAMKQAHRFSGAGQPYAGLTELGPHGPRWTGTIRLVPEVLDEPLRWKKPEKIFVNSMSDLFHHDVPDDFIERVFAVMAIARRHTFQILTKRPERMLRFCQSLTFERLIERANQNVYGGEHGPGTYNLASTNGRSTKERFVCYGEKSAHWPMSKPLLPNVHLGVSIEDQPTADARIPILLQTPAAVRFVSYEPALGAVSLSAFWDQFPDCGPPCFTCTPPCNAVVRDCAHTPRASLDWVIIGGESGPGARPCDLDWIRSIVQQCRAAGVPCFIKQLGARPYDESLWKCLIGDTNKEFNDQIRVRLKDKKGGDISEFPADLQVRQFP